MAIRKAVDEEATAALGTECNSPIESKPPPVRFGEGPKDDEGDGADEHKEEDHKGLGI